MISVNDDEDPHFRKAFFNPEECPSDCSRPCEKICPALAIPSLPIGTATNTLEGVIADRCYGCGRCFAVCPYDLIQALPYTVDYDAINQLLSSHLIDAVE